MIHSHLKLSADCKVEVYNELYIPITFSTLVATDSFVFCKVGNRVLASHAVGFDSELQVAIDFFPLKNTGIRYVWRCTNSGYSS